MEGYKLIVLDEEGKVRARMNVDEPLPPEGYVLPLRFKGDETSKPYKIVRGELPALVVPEKNWEDVTVMSDGEMYVYAMPTGEKHTWARRIFLGDMQLGRLERKFD